MAPVPKTFDGGQTPENATQNPTPFSTTPVPSIDLDQVKEVNVDILFRLLACAEQVSHVSVLSFQISLFMILQ